jgi:hypothetical protein
MNICTLYSNCLHKVSKHLIFKFVFLPCFALIEPFYKKGDFLDFSFYVRYSTLLHLAPLRFHCFGDAGIEPRTVRVGMQLAIEPYNRRDVSTEVQLYLLSVQDILNGIDSHCA